MEHRKKIGLEIRMLNNMFMRKMESIALQQGEDAPALMHGWILGYLYCQGDKDIYQKDIEKEFKLSRSSVTCILKALEEKKCIKRENVDFDARLKRIVLLPKGIEIHKKSLKEVQAIEMTLRKNISEEDLEVFYKVTNQVRQNLINSER